MVEDSQPAAAKDSQTVSLQHEVTFLKQQLRGMEILLQQNAQLEKEVERLCAELDEASSGIHKKGYLYKFREREIYFQPKWGSRYFVVQGNQLSYYGDEQELRPRRTITLNKCYVKEEGNRKGGLYHVFSIYLTGDETLAEDTLLLKLSCENAAESKQWIECLQQACDLDAEKIKSAKANEDEDDNVSIGMHLSPTRSYADTSFSPTIHEGENESTSSKAAFPSLHSFPTSSNKLTIDSGTVDSEGKPTLSRTPTGEWSEHVDLDSTGHLPELDESLLHPIMLTRVKSANRALKKSMSRQALSKRIKSKASRPDFTISGTQLSGMTEVDKKGGDPKKPPNTPATVSTAVIATKPKSFPGYKPMHTTSAPSPLSGESRPGEYSFRGYFNLGVIILVLTHFELIINNIMKYGLKFDLMAFILPPPAVIQDLDSPILPVTLLFHLSLAMSTWFLSVFVSFVTEYVAMKHPTIPESVIRVVNVTMGFLNVVMPCYWAWTSQAHPGANMLYLLQSVVIWMKLISYAHANKDLRILHKRMNAFIANSDSKNANATATASLTSSMKYTSNDELAAFVESSTGQLKSGATLDTTQYASSLSAVKDIEPPFLSYPQNITLPNLCYFMVAPTLCYQLNYPRTPKINWHKVLFLIARMIFVAVAILFSVEQYIAPTLEAVIDPMSKRNIPMILERLLKLSIPNTYVWLLGFYFYFHCWLNLLAELTRFGDRMFYKDWWNSKTIDKYWRTWNMPVHHWITRHLYHPLLRAGFGKISATFVVFLFSAVMHEVVISLPFHHISLHAFLGMFAQAPLIVMAKYVDRTFDNAFIGNALFWVTFCIVGQPMGVMMYYFDLTVMSMPNATSMTSTVASAALSAITSRTEL